ncbi:MAG: hypothetical protein CM15mP70_00710 [Pelagibacteraceae bacterium]|nr:MAG: hypothetical protein CM15mP70_00710 [Pelagibacteraceae bacterium]
MEKVDLQRSTHEDLFIPKRHQLEGCTNPIHQAHGIPNEYYTRSECFEMEGEHLFNKGWFAVGFVKDLPQPPVLPKIFLITLFLVVKRKKDEKKI